MLQQIQAAVAWLGSVDPALPRALLVGLVFLTVYVVRKLFPRTWEFFAGAIPVSVIDPAPLLLVLSKTWQAFPGALLGAVAASLATGGDMRASVKGLVFGALAAVAHEFAKAAPWLPYTGAVGRVKAPTLPVLCLFVPAAVVSAWPYLAACGPALRPPCDDAKMAAIDAAYVEKVTAACLPKYDRKEDCPEFEQFRAENRAELLRVCPQ